MITTHNRLEDLKITLGQIKSYFGHKDLSIWICDDFSNDGTSEFLSEYHPEINLIRNESQKGLIQSRNLLMNACTSEYAISLDDDLHLLTPDALQKIEDFFRATPDAAICSFRIYWNLEPPVSTESKRKIEKVNSFAGGAHAWRMEAWHDIDEYPGWFIFYGEEKHAAMQLFQKGWFCYYLPEVLAHHRVDLAARKTEKDYIRRLKRSIRSVWYLYFLFYPWSSIPRRFFYTLWQQLKTKVFKGDLKALLSIFGALLDVLLNFPRLIRERKAFSKEQLKAFLSLNPVKLYWSPDED